MKKLGFTLVELVVVLAVIAVLTHLAVRELSHLRDGKLDEIGSWFDYRTDCLGFRLQIAYEEEYSRIDGSESNHDWRVGFYVYLRAFGPAWGNVIGD